MIDPTVYFFPNLFNLDQYELSANFRVKAVDLFEAIHPTVYFDPTL